MLESGVVLPPSGRLDLGKSVRFGIVGLGIGRAHATGIQKSRGGQVLALCDTDPEVLAQQCQSFGVTRAYSDYRELCADPDVDAVCVCTPNYLHAEVAICALECGKHIIVEKPIGSSASEGERILEAAARFGKSGSAMTAFSSRFTGPAQLLRRAVDEGQLGHVYYARASYLRRQGIPGYGTWFTHRERSGGGALIDLGVHVLDVAWWLMGCPEPESCLGATFAEFGPRMKGLAGKRRIVPDGPFDVEDLGCGLIRFRDGRAISLEASWASHVATAGANVLLFGTRGGASLEPCIIHTDLYGESPVDIRPEVPQVYGHEGELQHFIDCIVEGRQPLATLEHGIAVQRMLDGIYESARSGGEVRF